MRVNIYAEEMTDRVEIIGKEIDGQTFTGCRFYLELPATVLGQQYQGPFVHRPGDDDSSAVTFWGKRDLRHVLRHALALLDEHYSKPEPQTGRVAWFNVGIGRATEPKWDGYDGQPTTDAALFTARYIQGVPMSDGGIQLELHAGGADVEIVIGPDGNVRAVSWERA